MGDAGEAGAVVISPRVRSERGLLAVAALLFLASAAATIFCRAAMSSMDAISMPGGWTMSMVWMQMEGQSWPGAAFSFLGMWLAMMVAMMLPSLLPVLWRCHRVFGGSGPARPGCRTAAVAVGYFSAWAACGMLVFPVGAMLASLAMRLPLLARAVPVLAGMVVLLAGALQFTVWKAHHLVCCRGAPGSVQAVSMRVGGAWRCGFRLGHHCTLCCAGLTASLLVAGVMDLYAMSAVFAAITLERLAPVGERMARVVGIVGIGTGTIMLARSIGIG